MASSEAIVPAVDTLTGLRPSGALTLANYAGAVKPIIKAQGAAKLPILLFVADLHGLTDQEPEAIAGRVESTAIDLLALGIDPKQVKIYVQSALTHEVNELAVYLQRHVRVAELLRQPALKDKLRGRRQIESASVSLLLYPVLMAADILLHRVQRVPVGKDQLAHLEIARLLARRFNAAHGAVFVEPRAQVGAAPRFMALRGAGKMSKSDPADALLLADDDESLRRKIAACRTANAGELSAHLASHAGLIRALSADASVHVGLDTLLAAHLRGEAVMHAFKQLFMEVATGFAAAFRARRAGLVPEVVQGLLDEGTAFAQASARATLAAARAAMRFRLAA